MSTRTFKWTVEIEVNEAEVADGINIDRPFSLHQAIMRGWTYMDGSHLTVKVLKSPSPESIAIVQGAYKRLGWVRELHRNTGHVLIELPALRNPGATYTRPLCETKANYGWRGGPSADAIEGATLCTECKRRDES